MQDEELTLRREIVKQCGWMNRTGPNPGASGKVSVRVQRWA